jgi:uncharacterized membrane protein
VRRLSSRGLDQHLETLLCYLGWWVTGLVFLFIERDDKDLRFHAAQSLVVFGTISIVFILWGSATAFVLFWVPQAFQLFQAVGNLLWLATVILWLFLLLKAYRGETFRVPVAGDLAVKIAGH